MAAEGGFAQCGLAQWPCGFTRLVVACVSRALSTQLAASAALIGALRGDGCLVKVAYAPWRSGCLTLMADSAKARFRPSQLIKCVLLLLLLLWRSV